MDELKNSELQIERYKATLNFWAKIIKVFIIVVGGTVLMGWINNVYQDRQLKRQEILKEKELKIQKNKSELEIQLLQEKAQADRRQSEMQYLGDFLKYALEDDVNRRLRFAEYFATLTVSPDLREKWDLYHENLIALVEKSKKIEAELSNAKQSGEAEKIKALNAEITNMRSKLASLSETQFKVLRYFSKRVVIRVPHYSSVETENSNSGRSVLIDGGGSQVLKCPNINVSILYPKTYIGTVMEEKGYCVGSIFPYDEEDYDLKKKSSGGPRSRVNRRINPRTR